VETISLGSGPWPVDNADEDDTEGYPRVAMVVDEDDDAITPLIYNPASSLASTPSLSTSPPDHQDPDRQSSDRSGPDERSTGGTSLVKHLVNTRREATRRERVEQSRDEQRDGYARLRDALPVSNQKSSRASILERGLSLVPAPKLSF